MPILYYEIMNKVGLYIHLYTCTAQVGVQQDV